MMAGADIEVVQALRLAFADARQVLSAELDAVKEIDAKASQMMTLNATILGAIIAGAGLLVGHVESTTVTGSLGARLGLAALVGGGLSFVASLAFSAATYLKKDLSVGLRGSDYVQVAERALNEVTFLEATLIAFAKGINENRTIVLRAARQLTWTLRLFVNGIAFSALGALLLLLSLVIGH
ncbi:MAG: hypothetical protein ACYDCK_01270 [Thermoplasmatota archaeon]